VAIEEATSFALRQLEMRGARVSAGRCREIRHSADGAEAGRRMQVVRGLDSKRGGCGRLEELSSRRGEDERNRACPPRLSPRSASCRGRALRRLRSAPESSRTLPAGASARGRYVAPSSRRPDERDVSPLLKAGVSRCRGARASGAVDSLRGVPPSLRGAYQGKDGDLRGRLARPPRGSAARSVEAEARAAEPESSVPAAGAPRSPDPAPHARVSRCGRGLAAATATGSWSCCRPPARGRSRRASGAG
jgi:hypothetical protein